MDEDLALNERRARSLVLVPGLIVGALFAVLPLVGGVVIGMPLLGVLVAPVVAGLFVLVSFTNRWEAAKRAVIATGSTPVTEADEPRLHNLVEGLCVGIGLEPPRLRIIEDPAPNALAIARSVDDADLVVTRGLLDALSLVELEAVLAHELARIRRGEAIVGPVAHEMLGNVTMGAVARAVVTRGEPIDTWSDLAAVEITRYPPALASALEKLSSADPAVPRRTTSRVAHLWIHGARAEGAFGEALSRVYEIPPPIGQRIEVLEEL